MTGAGRRAVVLGGGGVAGIAWESAVIATLEQHGVRLGSADVVVGTSAGSVVGTALASGDLVGWYRGQLEAPAADPDHAVYDALGDVDADSVTAAFAAAAESRADEEATRAELGRFARDAGLTRTEEASRARFASLLAAPTWPDADLRITAVDAEDGGFRVLTRDSGVDLISAVAASCAVPGVYPTITIEGRPYMDGGMRSATNADVAADCDRVLVLSCGPEAPASPLGPTLPRVAEQLRRTAEVLVIEADAETLAAFGGNTLSPAVREPAAEAGARQGALVAERVRAFWG